MAGCAAPMWVCSTTPVGAGRPRCAPAGRKRWRHWLRTFAYAAITPKAGKGDGLTSYLRVRFAQCDYVEIELEVNQGIVFAAGRRWMALRRRLIDSLRTGCAAPGAP